MEPMSCRKLQSLLTLLAGRIPLFFLLTLSALWTRSALAQLPPQTGLPPAPHLQLLHELQTPGLVSTLALSSDRTAADIAAVSAASARANACGRAAILEASDACYSRNSDVKKALYQVTSEELEMRGQALRVAVQSIYRRLISSGEMREGLEVTDTVLPYLPTGISFDEAEAVLRNAGFVVERRHEYGWIFVTIGRQLMHQFDAGNVAEPNVGDEAARLARRCGNEEGFRGIVGFRAIFECR